MKIWSIVFNPVSNKFFLVDPDGKTHMEGNLHQRNPMSSYAFDHGAERVLHDYDLVLIDGSGSGT